jgi:hypothetical protein
MIRALRAVIHEKASVKQAHEIFRALVSEKGKQRRKK